MIEHPVNLEPGIAVIVQQFPCQPRSRFVFHQTDSIPVLKVGDGLVREIGKETVWDLGLLLPSGDRKFAIAIRRMQELCRCRRFCEVLVRESCQKTDPGYGATAECREQED